MLYPPVPICVKSCPVARNKDIAIVISAVEFSARPANINSYSAEMSLANPVPAPMISSSSVNCIKAEGVVGIVSIALV